ncbi:MULTISPECIES: type II toxin-antitoxin system PemK/MazF family toxin [unclassified Methylobacterium]|jgi:mRNA interferase MazF|uniref:type II toxin-antitoxin system PemK/MazF family toxin n=1 Tax=unclassified Methylobacterium TaxID=2615210 RepID=UPI0013549CB3|nr:type II toxin-antitoxin system PemK/MazF family toxin [Methylobacterium sp. 2A]MWV21591.1 type II toxin-antitoxin system PemK/MazF family toxin [Methylobacterium sp. 2A]
MTTIPADPLHQPGDLILVEFGPVCGTEQDGRRPALVISEALMNAATRRVVVCPITSDVEPWPTKVMLPVGLRVRGAVLTDQVRSIDQRARILRRLGVAPAAVLVEVRHQIAKLLGL